MITCLVNPSRCGSTWLQHIIDKHFILTGLNDYSMEYEIIDHANGIEVIKNPPTKNFLFKYQYLYANKPEVAEKFTQHSKRKSYKHGGCVTIMIATPMKKNKKKK